MTNEIFLQGVSFADLKTSFEEIVKNEVAKVIDELKPQPLDGYHDLLTRKDTAELLGISLVTLNEWTKTGVIPAKRIGTRIRYEKQAVFNALKDIETIKYRRA